jgi:N-acetylmuramoyl-L-alanine amidase
MDADEDAATSGIETYFAATTETGPQPLRSLALAAAIHAATRFAAGGTDRGIRPGGFKVLKTKLPAIMIDCGFISHPTEAKLLSEPAHRQKLAEAISRGLTVYRAATAPTADPPK